MRLRSATSAAPAQPPTAQRDALPGLLPDIAAIIVNNLMRDAVRAFAATSTAAFTLVLQQRTDLVEYKTAAGLDHATARLDGGNAALQRSVLLITCRLPPPAKQHVLHLRMPLHSAARICSPNGCTWSADSTFRVLAPAAMRYALPCVSHLHCPANGQVAVPPGMAALQVVDMTRVSLRARWMPSSSAANVRKLQLRYSTLQRIPGGMRSLQEIDVGRCDQLVADWLPASSAASVHKLRMVSTRLQRVPEGMHALQELDVFNCRQLAEDWLPVSSAAFVRKLHMANTRVQRVPEGMHALQELSVFSCKHLAEDWLPASSAGRLHMLHAESSNMRTVPAGTSELRVLSMAGSHCVESSIPPGVLRSLELLNGVSV